MYAIRSTAARAAARKSHCFRTFPVSGGWNFEEAIPTATFEYAVAWAADGKDYVSHVEQHNRSVEIVVTCFKREIKDDVPQGCKFVPVTPSLWETQKAPKPIATPKPASCPRAVDLTPPSWAILDPPRPTVAELKAHLKPILAGMLESLPLPAASTAVSPVKLVWAFCTANPTLDRKTLIAALVAQGVHPATAAKQYSLWKKSGPLA